MVEWQFNERIAEVSRQHENFKSDSDYELMQLLIDVRDEPNTIAYNKVNDFLLETTAKAYGKNHTIDEINNDIPLRDGLKLHSKEIIPEELMAAYRADPTKRENRAVMLANLGSGLKADKFVLDEDSEALMSYLNNSIEYHPEAQDEEKKSVEDLIVGLTHKLVADPVHREYLSGNFNNFENTLSGVGRVGLTNKVLRNLGIDSLEDLMDI
jgi:hypothetical protein